MAAEHPAKKTPISRPATPWLWPDGKTQVSIEYRDGQPSRIHAIAVTVSADTPARQVEEGLRAAVTDAFAGDDIRPDNRTEIYVNAGGP